MFPDNEQEDFQDMMFDHLVAAGGEAEQIGALVYISELIKERKQKYYPNLIRVITNYDLKVSGGDITLNVSFATIDDKGKANITE